ncbi:MAG: hypothetical protein ABJN26_02010 [Stappiaceae bacterium]
MTCLELVVYTVKNAHKAKHARRAAYDVISLYDGFVSRQHYTAIDEPCRFTDIVHWRTYECARNARGRALMDPALAPFMCQLDEIISMDHYFEDALLPA